MKNTVPWIGNLVMVPRNPVDLSFSGFHMNVKQQSAAHTRHLSVFDEKVRKELTRLQKKSLVRAKYNFSNREEPQEIVPRR